MDQNALVAPDTGGGKSLILELEQRGIGVPVAYWRRTADEPDWRLRLATALYERVGQLGLYAEVMQGKSEFAVASNGRLGEIEFVSLKHREVVDLRYFAGTPVRPHLGGQLQSGGRIGDSYFEGIYIYRAEQLPAWDGVVPVTFAAKDRDAGTWAAYPGTLTFRDGLLTDVSCDGPAIRTKVRDGRLKATFVLVENAGVKDGVPTGTLTRYEYDHGRLWQRDARTRRYRFPAATVAA